MEIDRIFKQIQDIITNPTPPVIVLGSGASVSYGIASMWELAKMLKTFLHRMFIHHKNLMNV